MKEFFYEANHEKFKVTIQKVGENVWIANVNNRELKIHIDDRQSTRLDVRINGRGYHCHVDIQGNDRFISWRGSSYALRKLESLNDQVVISQSVTEKMIDPEIRAPMPGRIVKVNVKEGEKVLVKQPLMILEAMKMEFVITSPTEGNVQKVFYKENDQVDLGNTLITLSIADQ